MPNTDDPLLKPNDHLCERGNTLVANDGGGMVAWLDLVGNHRLEVSWCPHNYPALNVSVVNLSDEQLAAHINTKCGGWLIRSLNVAGVKQDGHGHVAEAEKRNVD